MISRILLTACAGNIHHTALKSNKKSSNHLKLGLLRHNDVSGIITAKEEAHTDFLFFYTYLFYIKR